MLFLWFLIEKILCEARPKDNQVEFIREYNSMSSQVLTANKRRSQRVLLQVRVFVEAEVENERIVRLEAFTLVVNAHGGLLEMSLRVSEGQKLVLISPSAGVRQSSKVVGIRKSQDGVFAVAFEFDDPAPQFWPIVFPPTDWELVRT